MKKIAFILFALALIPAASAAQTRRKPRGKAAAKTVAKKTSDTNSAPQIVETVVAPTSAPAKKNERAAAPQTAESQIDETKNRAPQKKNQNRESGKTNQPIAMPFVYEFAQPKFQIARVKIEHDAKGTGKITFEKQDLGEPLTDPLQISEKSLEKIKGLWNELNFLDSTENYQTPDKDFSHLGVMKLRRTEAEKTREAEFNWTANAAAKNLTDEYKKLTEQFVWIFEMNLARENFPLNSPKLVDNLESLMRRNLISDNKQMLPYLRQVVDDERIPLIARNHTKKIVERIEKEEK